MMKWVGKVKSYFNGLSLLWRQPPYPNKRPVRFSKNAWRYRFYGRPTPAMIILMHLGV